MSETASGFIKSEGTGAGAKFTSCFRIDGINYHFSGPISLTANFSSENATLTYTSVEQLTSEHKYSGTISGNDVSFMIIHGPTIAGPLDTPAEMDILVNGKGVWTQSPV